MDLINQHIAYYLDYLICDVNPFFVQIFSKVQNPLKDEYESLLKYLDILLDRAYSNGVGDLNVLHIHFEEEFSEEIRALISEYILIKQYLEHQTNDAHGELPNPVLLEAKESLKRKFNKLSDCPSGASGKNGGNRLYKKWIASQSDTENLLRFYGELNETSKLSFKTLFNCQIKTKNTLEEIFRTAPFALNIEKCETGFTYCFVNSDKGLNGLDSYKMNPNLVDSIESIVIFDCERKQVMTNFSLDELNKWNVESDTDFKRFLIVTFGKSTRSLQSIRSKLEIVKNRFKIPAGKCYTILNSELNYLQNQIGKPQTQVEFIGFENSLFWGTFLMETNIRELYELRSFKMMNIYALCFNEEIKNHILNDLFSNPLSKLITENTKQGIEDLSDEAKNAIRDSLDHTLNLIIHTAIKENIAARIEKDTVLVIPGQVLNDSVLKLKVIAALRLTKKNNLISWSQVNNSINKPILILCYRDQGKMPYYFYPNITEPFELENNVSAVFLNFLFGGHYSWAKYNLYRDYYKSLSHKFRIQYFDWKNLLSEIEKMRPKTGLNINPILEYEYSNSESRESYRVKLKGQKPKIYNSSDLFIIRNGGEGTFKVDKLSNHSSPEASEGIPFLQNLEEIQENINIYEEILNTEQQEQELKIIQKQFNLGDENAGRLWKIQLKKLSDFKGEEALYNELRKYLELKRLRIVSFYHYKNTWINPQSDSMAPLSNRIFIALCEFLGIPNFYFVIIQRMRNATKQSSRQSTTQMNRFLRDLFNDGCFNIGVDARLVISNKLPFYRRNHPLDELGIGENYLIDNLVTLIELIRPELNLLEVEYIEKIEQ